MYVDLLNPNNFISYNIKLCKYIGLHESIYLSILLKLDKNENNEICVDRNKVKSVSTFDADEQKTLEETLSRINFISNIREEDKNIVYMTINEENIVGLILEDNAKHLKQIKQALDVKSGMPIGKMTQRQKQCYELKSSIHCDNEELLQAYRDWVDGVYANPKGFLSVKSISIFQVAVDDFAKGNLDLALKIIDIATVNGYRDATWAINVFNKDYAAQWKKEHSTAATINRVRVNSEEVF